MAERDKNGSQETERYKQAANDALQLLDWCIGYLEGIHKGSYANVLASSRATIRQRLMQEPEEPVPSGESS
jgi:hypothetical protein